MYTKFDVDAEMPVEKPVVLIVEDDEDFRRYLKANLQSFFSIIDATNGYEGWQKALALSPQVVISDVDMPVMGGLALSRKLRGDKRTAHIPILLLTALDREQDYLMGLQAGAIDYIVKPVNIRILVAKVRNWCVLREDYRLTYTNHINVHADTQEFESRKVAMMKAIRLYIEDRLNDPHLSVNELAKQLGIARGTLYTKIIEMTGMKPLEYIRSVRLERAVQLLHESDFNVVEIAKATGFNTPSYFSKIFKSKFNQLPSNYINATRSSMQSKQLSQ